ncbi:MAG: hypothetical protein DRP79_07765 [Planctomycetota bacterium]|nr:MAG: hypothetical protein DRP79_07765 [Planctomycetota bacterium]
MYKIFLILRYLTRKTLILLSMGGVTVAVMVFIVVFSVLEGFGRNIEERLRGTISDIVVEDVSGDGLADYEEIMREAEAGSRHIVACSPFIERIAMFQEFREDLPQPTWDPDEGRFVNRKRRRFGETCYGLLRGIDPEREARTGRLEHFLRKGNYYKMQPDRPLSQALRPGSRAVLVGDHRHAPGYRLARDGRGRYVFAEFRDGRWGLVEPKGSTLAEQEKYMRSRNAPEYLVLEQGLIITSAVTQNIERARHGTYDVVGTFKTGGYEYDSAMVYMNIKDAQILLNMAGRPAGEFAPAQKPTVTGISVRLDSYDNLEDARATIEGILQRHGANCRVRGWTEIRKNMLDAIAIEKAVAVIILTCIVLVMGFGIFSILSLYSAQKGRDIGVLKSIGATDGGVMLIFLAIGGAVGMVGALLGTALGILIASNVNGILSFLEKYTGWELFPKNVFYIEKIPSMVHPSTYGAISGVTLLICLVASILPAMAAARRDPAKTLVVE